MVKIQAKWSTINSKDLVYPGLLPILVHPEIGDIILTPSPISDNHFIGIMDKNIYFIGTDDRWRIWSILNVVTGNELIIQDPIIRNTLSHELGKKIQNVKYYDQYGLKNEFHKIQQY